MHELKNIIQLLDSYGFDLGDTRISLYRAALIVLVIIGVTLVARLGGIASRILFRRIKRLDSTQQLLGEKIATIIIWVLAIFTGIELVGIDLTALAVFSGALGLAVGFGLQKTLGNLIAGIILLMDRSIKPGDVIAVTSTGNGSSQGTVGEVKRIGIRAVSLITRDKVEFLIPNENLMINQVENWSYSSRDVRLKIPVPIDHGADIELAEKLMLQAANASPRVLADPAPTVWLTEYADNALRFEIQVWIDDPEEGIGNVRSDVLKRLWPLFLANGVRIPHSQHDIHVKELPGARPSTAV